MPETYQYVERELILNSKCDVSWAPVAHTHNPATEEAEVRRILVQSQPGQIVCVTQTQKRPSQKGLLEWLQQ
jgi:hypothetical protein